MKHAVATYHRVLINNSVYCSNSYKIGRHDNSFIKMKNNSYGQISEIIFDNSKITLKVRLLVCIPLRVNNVCPEKMLTITDFSNSYVLIDIDQIAGKCVFVNTGDQQFVCEFPNLFEIQ